MPARRPPTRTLPPREVALRAAGRQAIRAGKNAGTQREGRTGLDVPLRFQRAGSTLVTTQTDRLARNLTHLPDLVHGMKAKGATLGATEQPVDAATAAGKAVLDMLGAFARFEPNLRRGRRMEGIAAAKERKPTTDPAEVRRMHLDERLSPTAMARRLGIARSSAHGVLPGTQAWLGGRGPVA